MGTVDGPGLRAVVFTSGCPLRCACCHNPDTHVMTDGELTEASLIVKKILRLKPYIKDGGVTFSGGEPCVQARFISEIVKELKKEDLHIALDTSGAVMNSDVRHLLNLVDLVLLDIKFTNEDDYFRYTGGHLADPLAMLSECDKLGIPVWIRHVVIPNINDTEGDVRALADLCRPYDCITKIELLPFKKLCLEKYEALGIDFPLKSTPEMSGEKITYLESFLK